MTNREFAPQYFIRIITSSGEINLNNVLSITTSKDVNSDTGSFEIVLDYNQSVLNAQKSVYDAVTYRQNSIFFQIKPMDYIEIYLAREIQNIGNNFGFGVYDKDGTFVRNFNETIDAQNNKIQLDGTQTDALNIVDRILNPHLVFCGFVDGINNSFGLTENSTNNHISIRGKCLSKFLALHYLFFNFPYADIFLEQAKASISLNGLRANEAVDAVLTRFCWGIFTKNKIDINKSDLDNKTKYVGSDGRKFPAHEVVWDDTLKDKTFVKTLHHEAPSFRYLYWGTSIDSASKFVPKSELIAENGYYKWGRMDYSNSLNRNILNINAESPVLSILKQSAQMPFNEFFVDEIGNITLRRTLDAWDYTSGVNPNTGEIIDDPDKYVKEWVLLDEQDIRSWNFDISDDELKTIVIDIPVGFFIGTQPIMVGQVGVAPLAEQTVGTLLASEKKKATSKQQISQISQAQAELQQTFKRIQALQSNHLDEYNLSTNDGILKFWARFGIRPVSINDIYSDNFSRFYESAWALFEKYSNYWWSGTLIVKGDSKYKMGQKLKIKDFALDNTNTLRDFNCYVQAVSHNYIWGQDWTTVLRFTRGQIEGTTMSQTSKPVNK